MKRLLLLFCTLLCANVLFAQGFWEGGLYYTITGAGKVTVSYCHESVTSVNIPSSVTKTWTHVDWGHIVVTDSVRTYSVTSIGGAFRDCSSLTSVSIPNSVTSIGYQAFYGCSSLTSVDIPNSVTYIGERAFAGCSSLTSVTIPNSVTSIGEQAFYGCSSLTSVTIPNSVDTIGGAAFGGCSSLTSVTIPNSVTSIGGGAFSGCSSLDSVTIGNSVTSIGQGAFSGCSSLTSVTIPNSVTYIGYQAFGGCRSLTSVTIPNSVTYIEGGAFYNAGVDASVIIDSVAYKVPPATIPNSCYAHQTDYGLITFHIGDSTYAPTKAMVYYCNESRSGHVDILSSIEIAGNTYPVTSIREFAFQYCSGLTSVNIPNSVTSIGRAAFSYCSSLTSVTLPENITYIGESAFVYAGVDASVIIDSVTYKFFTATIPDSYYANLTDYSYPISGYRFITFHIGDSTYAPTEARVYDCEQSRSGHVDILSSIEFAGNTCSVISIGDDAFSGCSSLTSVNIPNSVTRIGWGAFYGCSSLTSVNIPNSVTYIEIEAFRNCSSLTSIDIPNSVTYIEEEAFALCSSLTSVTIGNSVTTIEDAAFYGCSSLTSVTIPNSVTSIGEGAFYNCSGLTTLNYNAINCNYNGFEYYDYFPFDNCPITTINIGNSVQIIPNYFAYNLDSLTSVTIGNSVTSIGSSAFYNCSSLTSVTCLADIPPALGNNVFNNTPSNKILYVNCGLKDDYISSWGDYFNSNNIQEITFDINTYVNNESGGSVAIERNNCSTATLTATANICYQFVRWNDGNTENPRVVYLSSDTSFTAIFDSILFDTIINATINAGETYTEFGFDVNEEGTYTRILITEDGCDSIVTLTLNIIPVFNTELSATICQGQVYNENGFNVSEAGTYTQILTASNGFDSIVTLSLNVLPIFNTELSANICQGQVYNENGFNVSEAGTYTQTLQTINGCDSIVTLSLNVNPIFNTELSATICQGQVYNENGFNVSETGVYTQTLTSANGCDSIVTLTLNVNPTFNTELSATICEGQVYAENGFNVNEAGTYTQSLQTINGCDSIVTLTLNVNPTFNTELTASICEGQVYDENGFNVSEAGTYTQSLQTINGCDSIVTLTLNVNPVFNTELTATICQGQVYTENGFNVSEAGTYTQSLQTINGCDSIVTLTLNVNPIFNTELSANICQGQVYTENGFNVSEAGVYTQTLQTVNGCDSIVTLSLNVNPTFNTELSATICQGQVYTENGFNVSEAGVYTQTLTSVNGCDSIVTLTLNVNPTFNTELSANICQGQVYNENGFNISEAGVYTQTLTSVNGCDSIVTLTVSVNPTFDTTINATINAGETYAEFGFNESEAGTYVQNLQTEAGCDSTITLILDVNSSLMDVEYSELSFYPNPTDSKITFSSTIESIEVIDQTGRCVLTFSNAREINIESLPSGAYYLRLTNNDKAIMRKVIKE